MLRRRLHLLAAALPGVVMFGACSGDPAAPDASTPASDRPGISFHVIAQTCDFMTGGGFVGSAGSKITYGLHAGRSRGGTVFGHLTVVDHQAGNRYQSTQINTYGRAVAPFFVSVPSGGVTRVFEGKVRVNGGAVQNFTAYLNDSGEPGKRVDRIFFKVGGIQIISGPASGGLPSLRLVDGGNLQFHDHCIPGNPQSGK
jgi:hypothetical protein